MHHQALKPTRRPCQLLWLYPFSHCGFLSRPPCCHNCGHRHPADSPARLTCRTQGAASMGRMLGPPYRRDAVPGATHLQTHRPVSVTSPLSPCSFCGPQAQSSWGVCAVWAHESGFPVSLHGPSQEQPCRDMSQVSLMGAGASARHTPHPPSWMAACLVPGGQGLCPCKISHGLWDLLCSGNAFIPSPRNHFLRCQALLDKVMSVSPQTEIDGLRNIWIIKPAAKSRGRGESQDRHHAHESAKAGVGPPGCQVGL